MPLFQAMVVLLPDFLGRLGWSTRIHLQRCDDNKPCPALRLRTLLCSYPRIH